ncbi:MAG: AMP-binding protein, partial [Myxococcota bacterium]
MSTPFYDSLPEIEDYDRARREFRLDLPETLNFGFDVIDRNRGTAYVTVPRDGSEPRRVSFGELSESSTRFATALLALGAQAGDGLFVMLPRIPAWYDVIIGSCKAATVAMPGTNLLTAKDIAYRLKRSGARFAVVSEDHVEKVASVQRECPSLEHLIVVGAHRKGWHNFEELCASGESAADLRMFPTTRRDDPMLVYFTSGTTAYPKMVPRDHSYAFAHAITGKYWLDLKPGGIHWTLTDTGWAKAAWGLLYPPWLAGATTVLYEGAPKFDADAHLRTIERLRVETFCAPPTVYRLFAQMDLSQYDLSSVRHSLSAGEPLNPEAIRVWEAATGTKPHDGYGQTETVCLVSNYPGIEVRPGSMGKAT